MIQSIRDFWVSRFLEHRHAHDGHVAQAKADLDTLDRFGLQGSTWLEEERSRVRQDLERLEGSQLGGDHDQTKGRDPHAN